MIHMTGVPNVDLPITVFGRRNEPQGENAESIPICSASIPKEDRPGWSQMQFLDRYRKRSQCTEACAVVLDLDNADLAVSVLLDLYEYGFVAHTTSTPGRWRVIVRTNAVMTAIDYTATALSLIETLPEGGIDVGASTDPARFWYQPDDLSSWVMQEGPELPLVRGTGKPIQKPTTPGATERRVGDSVMLSLARMRGPVSRISGGYRVVCPWRKSHVGAPHAAIFDAITLRAVGAFSCLHTSCLGKRWRDVIEWHSASDRYVSGWDE